MQITPILGSVEYVLSTSLFNSLEDYRHNLLTYIKIQSTKVVPSAQEISCRNSKKNLSQFFFLQNFDLDLLSFFRTKFKEFSSSFALSLGGYNMLYSIKIVNLDVHLMKGQNKTKTQENELSESQERQIIILKIFFNKKVSALVLLAKEISFFDMTKILFSYMYMQASVHAPSKTRVHLEGLGSKSFPLKYDGRTT